MKWRMYYKCNVSDWATSTLCIYMSVCVCVASCNLSRTSRWDTTNDWVKHFKRKEINAIDKTKSCCHSYLNFPTFHRHTLSKIAMPLCCGSTSNIPWIENLPFYDNSLLNQIIKRISVERKKKNKNLSPPQGYLKNVK